MALTIGTGPFGETPAGVFNFEAQGPERVIWREDHPRQVRVTPVVPLPSVAHGDSSSALRVNRTLVIPASELEWRFTPSGGPGGQHANRSSTRAEVTFDVAGSPSLGPRQRSRLLEQLGPIVNASADDERSQARNRELTGSLDRQTATADISREILRFGFGSTGSVETATDP